MNTIQKALKKLIPEKWHNEIPPSTSPSWNIIWHEHKAQKEVTFLWRVNHKVVVVNGWHIRILTAIDKSCPHCDQQSVVESTPVL